MMRPGRIIGLLFVGLIVSTAHAEPWSVKLGFPPGRRVVILEARELGLTWEINDAATKLLEDGDITSASALAIGPWFQDIANWYQQHPQHDVGLSIATINPYPTLNMRLLTSERGPTSLVNADGYPWQSVVQFTVNADVEDVRNELDAQILAARSAGLTPSHISGYYGTAFSRPDLTAIFLAASQKYWIPMPVVELTPELIDRFRQEGYPVDENMIRLITSYPLPKVDDLQIFLGGTSFEETRDNFCQLLQLIPPGLTQIICRPAVESSGMQRLTPDWQQRKWTAQALSDPKVREAIASEEVILTNWRDIMHRFELGTPLELKELRRDEKQLETSLESE